MNEPTLVVLAAGIGSRFGGLKQITPVDEFHHSIIDFSLYDAHKAGFKKVAFVIKHKIEDDFKKAIGTRMEKYFDVSYVFQELETMLPPGYAVPAERLKPWGTGHAVLCAMDAVDGPFAVINSDDFYGAEAYRTVYQFLTETGDNSHAMIAYKLRNTVTENGTVARGICKVENGYLTDVVERTKIYKRGDNAEYTENDREFIFLPGETNVSMNFWGFGHDMLKQLRDRFPAWLDDNLSKNPLKCEYFLPFVANSVIKEREGSVRVLECNEKWHGVTYKDDLPEVIAAIKELRTQNKYPEMLLE